MVYVDLPEEQLRSDNLQRAIAGQVPAVPPSIALGLVPKLSMSRAEKCALLAETVRNDGLDAGTRAAAMRIYARLGGEEAIPVLVQALRMSDERLAVTAASALGRVGTPDHLAALRKAHGTSSLQRRRVTFAEVLIVHRFGLGVDAVELPAVETQPVPDAAGALTFASLPPGVDRRARALASIQSEFPAFEPDAQDVHEIQCGPRLIEVAVDRRYLTSDGIKSLGDKPALPAIVAYQDLAYDSFHTRLLVMSRPSGRDAIAVVVTRMNGDPVYVGEGTLRGSEAEVALRSVHSPGLPRFSSRVRIGTQRVEITGFSDRKTVPGKVPTQA